MGYELRAENTTLPDWKEFKKHNRFGCAFLLVVLIK